MTNGDFSGSAAEHFALVQERDRSDGDWATLAREKDEKWSLYLTSLTRAGEALEVAGRKMDGQGAGEGGVKELVDGSADVLGPYLGETVSLSANWIRKHSSLHR